MIAAGRRVFFFNPPGRLFQRGEDRSQGNVEDATATVLRTPIDLCAMAAVARAQGASCRIVDFPAEGGNWDDFSRELDAAAPDVAVMSVTSATLLDDLRAMRMIRERFPWARLIAKGAVFFKPPLSLLKRPELDCLDYAIGGEADFAFEGLLSVMFGGADAAAVDGISYRTSERGWRSTEFGRFEADLDRLPLPARDLIRNELYVRPDTNEPQTTIVVARGCPYECTFCLTPEISGRQARHRSPGSVCDEIEHCVRALGLRNFFLRADTFTLNEDWVGALCGEIFRRGLDISWVANSRVAPPVRLETFAAMRRAGCWLVAFGFESGSPRSLERMKKTAGIEQAYESARRARAAGLKVFGLFLIGLPWEEAGDIAATEELARRLACDFYEVHIAVPYPGTELGREVGLPAEAMLGPDYFTNPPVGTAMLSRERIIEMRRAMIRKLHLNPSYVGRRLLDMRDPRKLRAYLRFGWRLLRATWP